MKNDLPNQLKKLARFTAIYGPHRTAVKAMGRLRTGGIAFGANDEALPAIAIIGCGQFAYATIGYFLREHARVVVCFDTNREAALSLARAHRDCRVVDDAQSIFDDPDVRVVFIASNHATHADYAASALNAGKDVYVEKPISVSLMQLTTLTRAIGSSRHAIYAGYNRPFSRAIADVRAHLGDVAGKPLTLSCFISGHVLDADHWYRHPDEGTRICGNVGHWLDLAVHLLAWRYVPDRLRISLLWSDDAARDDDVAITIASDAGDLISIVLTARTEPFEGINESINVQWGDTIAKIDDFRRLEIWRGSQHIRRRYWPKDVGHARAIAQPFVEERRPWREVEDSTLLMLHIMEMVQTATSSSTFSFPQARAALDAAVKALDP